MNSPDIVGIDLGTTNSCVAVYGRFPEVGQVYEDINVTVLSDPDGPPGLLTVPSVVLVQQGTPIVGHVAKNAMGMGNEPIAFAKRYMGTEKVFEAGGERYTPVDVSRFILQHLLKMASSRLDTEVRRAIITVPARFTTAMKQDTRRAGDLAGVEVVEVFLEPWASALAASRGRHIEDGWVFVYDFGGGTFDAAVMKFESGTSTQHFSDGDPYLGGYDIDRALAEWVIEQLEQRGYNFAGLDTVSNPRHRALFDRLCYLCEQAKKTLSKVDEAPLVLAGQALVDLSGREIQEVLTIPRSLLESLLSDPSWDPYSDGEPQRIVDRTIFHCRRALEKARITVSDVSRLFLVGGSSYIPIVQQRVAKFFNREPILFEPDLSVAIGAAIRSSSYFRTAARGERVALYIDGKFPVTTSERTIVVTGRADGAPAGSWVAIVRDDGTTVRCELGSTGHFAAAEVPVREEDTQTYTVQVVDPDNKVLVREQIEVVHSTEGGGHTAPGGQAFISAGYATEPYYIATADGLRLIAGEGTPLPFEHQRTFRTYTTGEFLWVPIYEGEQELCVLRIDGLGDLPADSLVRVTVSFSNEYQLTAVAEVPARARTQEITADLRRPNVDRQHLEDMFARLSQRARELVQELLALGHTSRAVLYGPQVERAIERIEELFQQQGNIEPELASQINHLAALVAKVERVRVWMPSQQEYQAVLGEIDTALERLEHAGQPVHDERQTRQRLSRLADEAYDEDDLDGWRHANQQLARLLQSLHTRLAGPSVVPASQPTTRELKQQAQLELDELLGLLTSDPEAAAAYNEARTGIEGVSDDAPPTLARVRLAQILAEAENAARRAQVRHVFGNYPDGAIPIWEGTS